MAGEAAGRVTSESPCHHLINTGKESISAFIIILPFVEIDHQEVELSWSKIVLLPSFATFKPHRSIAAASYTIKPLPSPPPPSPKSPPFIPLTTP